MMNYISIKEAAIRWGISKRRIQKLCQDNRITGVRRFGRSWMIPINAKKPNDSREKNDNYYSDKRINMDLYGNEIRILSTNEKCTVYFIENKTGSGTVTYYNVFPGIEIYYNDFHMSDGFTRKHAQSSNIIEINHCRLGRFECEFKDGGYAYLGEGDLAINMLNNYKDTAYFPLSHYHGISIVINIPEANKTINDIMNIFQDIKIDIDIILKNAKANNGYFIIRATNMIEHIFYELYHAPDDMREGYIKLKIIELLIFLSRTNIENQTKKREYFPKSQVEKMKEIREFLVTHLDQIYTLAQLSEHFLIPMSTMKRVFKGIYGAPILTYIRKYRIQEAAQMLINSDLSISEISDKVGYENPAKFSEAFKNLMKLAPSEYRKNSCPLGKILDQLD